MLAQAEVDEQEEQQHPQQQQVWMG